MGDTLKRRIRQERFESPVQEAILNLMVACDFLRRRVEKLCSEHEITSAQYNVLRILRGIYPEGHPRCEIASRMVEKSPDITRLVDRLEAQGLVQRDRSRDDRRLSLTRITARGLDLLKEISPKIDELNRLLAKRLSRRDCIEISRICESIYADQE
jgi:DNA-binding MarR family transcriptional regulator